MRLNRRGEFDLFYLLKLFLAVFIITFAASAAVSYYVIAPIKEVYLKKEEAPVAEFQIRHGEVVAKGLREPYGIAFGPDGGLYYVDFNERTFGRLKRDPASGGFSGEFEILKNELAGPADLVYANGHFWISAMSGKGRVYKIDPEGRIVKTFDNPYPGAANGMFKSIAVNKDGSIFWLAIRDRGVVAKFDHNLKFKAKTPEASAGEEGVHFRQPNGLFADELGNLYVTDKEQNKVYALNDKEETTAEISHAYDAMDGLNAPGGVVADSRGYIYVADSGNNRVVIFNARGEYETAFNFENFEAQSFYEPRDLAIDPANEFLYISGGDRNQKDGRIWRIKLQ